VKKELNNLKDYILHLSNWIPEDILNQTLKELKKEKNWQQHQYTNTKTFMAKSKNKEKELDVCYGDNLTCVKKIQDLVWKGLEKYIVKDKLGGDVFKGWSGFSKLRFNRYNKNQIMSKHADHIVSLFSGDVRGIPILSIVGILNDNYQGGEFVMFNDYKIKFKPGDLIIFPSVFLYPHKVNPVTNGTRYSFVSWCY
tara:strand:- start:3191 stop:3778 length:588 start_codon:yes stop_codon:yes gene_type:complete